MPRTPSPAGCAAAARNGAHWSCDLLRNSTYLSGLGYAGAAVSLRFRGVRFIVFSNDHSAATYSWLSRGDGSHCGSPAGPNHRSRETSRCCAAGKRKAIRREENSEGCGSANPESTWNRLAEILRRLAFDVCTDDELASIQSRCGRAKCTAFRVAQRFTAAIQRP